MPDTKISAAADIGTLTATDMVPVARSGSTTSYKGTMAEVATFTSAAYVPNYSVATPNMDGTGAAGTATTVSRGDHVHPTDTSRAPLASPTFTGSPAAPTPTTGDSTTRIATTAFVQAQMVASGAGVSTWNTRAGAVVLQQADITAVGALHDVGRNLLHNPLFNVAQRGAGPFTAAGYMLDRWAMTGADTWSVTQAAIADAGKTAIGDEAATNAISNNFTGGAGTSAWQALAQYIEDVRRLGNKTVTVSFWAIAAAGTPKLGVSIDQYFGTGGSPSATVNGNGTAVTISTTWTRYSVTLPVPSVVGKTVGTNNDHATILRIWYSSGATNNVRAGNIGVQSGIINLWGVQLEIGSVATPLEKPDPADDLRKCQRFYQAILNTGFWGTVNANGQNYAVERPFAVQMRAAPSITFANTSYSNASAVSASLVTSQHVRVAYTITSTSGPGATFTDILASADL
jgi:hypothetical protein